MECAYMSDRDFAEMLGLPLKYVQKMIRNGKGPEYIMIGRYRRIKRSSAMKWIEDHSSMAATE